ncbi:MAG: hypothetical protein LBP79_06885 [Clostridiales bacterium]|jgi:gas vesicle protein|nr:hypothetical protein [Clostridiales bacterium]
MARKGIFIGALIGATAATLIVNSKRTADSLIKKGKKKLKDKVEEMLD